MKIVAWIIGLLVVAYLIYGAILLTAIGKW